jgi:hypothetical protein
MGNKSGKGSLSSHRFAAKSETGGAGDSSLNFAPYALFRVERFLRVNGF